jgi:F0F1-type ATP synthase membrane subunit b/b'
LSPILLSALALASEEAAHHGGGIPLDKIGLHAVNLVILVGALVFFARRPIADALANRAAGIRRDIEDSGTRKADAERRFAEINARLDRFEQHLADMKAEAEREAAREAEHIRVRTEQDAAMLAAAAERSIREETRKARVALQKDAVELAVKVAEEGLKAKVTEGDQNRLAQEFLGTLKTEVRHG